MASSQRSRVPPDMAVGFIGAGRMAQAMARGFITSGELNINISREVIRSKNILFIFLHVNIDQLLHIYRS